jgi:hypothetical protein
MRIVSPPPTLMHSKHASVDEPPSTQTWTKENTQRGNNHLGAGASGLSPPPPPPAQRGSNPRRRPRGRQRLDAAEWVQSIDNCNYRMLHGYYTHVHVFFMHVSCTIGHPRAATLVVGHRNQSVVLVGVESPPPAMSREMTPLSTKLFSAPSTRSRA